MSLSNCYLEYGRHVARLRRRRRAYTPTSNTASHDNHEKINLWVAYGAPLGGPLGRRSSAIILIKLNVKLVLMVKNSSAALIVFYTASQ